MMKLPKRLLSTIPTNLKPTNKIPGPLSFPLVGCIPSIFFKFGSKARAVGYLHVSKWLSEYGNIVKINIPATPTVIFVFDANHFEKVYRASGTHPKRPGLLVINEWRKTKCPFRGESNASGDEADVMQGLLTAEGENWKKLRNVVQSSMMNRPLTDIDLTESLNEITDMFIEKEIESLFADGEKSARTSNFTIPLHKWSMELIGKTVFNLDYNNFTTDDEPAPQQLKYIANLKEMLCQQSDLETDFVKRPSLKSHVCEGTPFDRIMQDLASFIQPTYRKAFEKAKINVAKREVSSIIDDLAVKGLFKDKEREIAIVCEDVMIAGIDTTAYTLAFLLYHLATNPEKQKKLQKEIDRVMIENEKDSKSSKSIKDTRQAVPYLGCCLKESQRLMPVAPANIRALDEDIELGGYHIEKGTHIVLSHLDATNRELGPDFIPERWERNFSDHSVPKVHPFLVLPFGHGPRMCIGRRLAEQYVSVGVMKIMERYNVGWDSEKELGLRFKVIAHPDAPLRFVFERRR